MPSVLKTMTHLGGFNPSRCALRHDALPWSWSSATPCMPCSDPGFTLRTYTHLLPTGEHRTRQAVDRALTGGAATADGLPTAQGPN